MPASGKKIGDVAAPGDYTQPRISPEGSRVIVSQPDSRTGNRDLYDDFGVAASPTTGLASIIYSDDQYDPSGPNAAGCDASANNMPSCDHTAIATQTGGFLIFGERKK